MKRRKKLSKLANEIVRLRDRLELSQDAMAKLLGSSRPAVSAWEIGRAIPPPSILLKLARKSDTAEQRAFFITQSGLDEQMIIEAAEDLFQKLMEPSSVGETVRIPRFRLSMAGREGAGGDVPLPSEFIPNPTATICFASDAESPLLACPKGLVILDTSVEGQRDLRQLWGSVVAIRYTPGKRSFHQGGGILVGRLTLEDVTWDARGPDVAGLQGRLFMLEGEHFQALHLGNYIEADGMRGVSRNDIDGRQGRMKEIRERGIAAFELRPEVEILGKVIGRLTGHLARDLWDPHRLGGGPKRRKGARGGKPGRS